MFDRPDPPGSDRSMSNNPRLCAQALRLHIFRPVRLALYVELGAGRWRKPQELFEIFSFMYGCLGCFRTVRARARLQRA